MLLHVCVSSIETHRNVTPTELRMCDTDSFHVKNSKNVNIYVNIYVNYCSAQLWEAI